MRIIFEFEDYKTYLNELIAHKPSRGHGFRTVMAEALNCRVAFISQVLNKRAQLSLEQAEKLNELLNHSLDEADFFILLVQYARAGTHFLRERFKHQIDRERTRRQILKERIDIKDRLSLEDQTTYYSHWYYAAIHILSSLKKVPNLEFISKTLNLSPTRLNEIIDFLIKIGLVQEQKGQLTIGKQRIFLDIDSPLISKHHTNWRMQAIQSLDRDLKKDFHFTGIVSLSAKDVSKAKEELIKGMESARKIVRDSLPEEEIFCMNLDFFKVI